MNTKTIWKYQLSLSKNTFTMDALGEPCRVAMQDGIVTMWAIVNPKAPQVERNFFCSGTGHDVSDTAKYVGSATDGPFEWHVWELMR